MTEEKETYKQDMPKVENAKSREKAVDKNPEDYFRWGVFLTTMLLIVIAALQLYFTLDDVIRIWFEYQYVSMIKALYNIFIIVVCVYIMRLFVFRKQA
ncbi:hypothetical protein V7O66_11415 [Methanolobus sp. ZRKC3]|uniref:hypothetical protein n=1 Tax=Methanolobus sp. ZRKC3 TaxID=3125786 RepID=UPI003244A052